MTMHESRYARHYTLPQVGKDGQEILRASSVLIVGVGGLGCAVAVYLAGAGIGRIALVDDDVVSLSNLHRQVLYRESDVGKLKVHCAARVLTSLNSEVNIVTISERLSEQHAKKWFADYDVIVDASDNFETRYIINRTCIALRKCLVWAAIDQFKGQISVVSPSYMAQEDAGCFECFCAHMPVRSGLPNCAGNGILGSVAGTVGTIQATEVVKALLSMGEGLAGYILCYDALTQQTKRVRLKQRSECKACTSVREQYATI